MRIEIAREEEGVMRNSIRCCISCILPCGALDVIRIVHANGRVEEISGGSMIKAGDIMKAHPKHVLKKPSSPSSQDGVVPKIVVVPPDALLQRGKIYFLMPLPPSPPPAPDKNNHHHHHNHSRHRSSGNKKPHNKRKENDGDATTNFASNKQIVAAKNDSNNGSAVIVSSDRYLTEILSEKISTQRDRRRGRVAVWRPHLESISESPTHL